MRKMMTMRKEGLNLWEKTMERANRVIGFKISFLSGNGSQKCQKVEVRNVNFQDLMRHMWRGETVLITPKLLENPSAQGKHRAGWYFTHI